jgi:hypothetical protein
MLSYSQKLTKAHSCLIEKRKIIHVRRHRKTLAMTFRNPNSPGEHSKH